LTHLSYLYSATPDILLRLPAIPDGRYGQGDEVAGMVSYLASSEADFVTAQVSKLMAAIPLEQQVIPFF
jgi:NAD(P)-dependent dehydrogenase (short-subunit alcohol dehydrogenase family)